MWVCLSIAYPTIRWFVSVFPLNQWEFQDPKMEVLYHIRPYFVGISSYIGLKNRPKIYGIGTSNQSDPEIPIENRLRHLGYHCTIDKAAATSPSCGCGAFRLSAGPSFCDHPTDGRELLGHKKGDPLVYWTKHLKRTSSKISTPYKGTGLTFTPKRGSHSPLKQKGSHSPLNRNNTCKFTGNSTSPGTRNLSMSLNYL